MMMPLIVGVVILIGIGVFIYWAYLETNAREKEQAKKKRETNYYPISSVNVYPVRHENPKVTAMKNANAQSLRLNLMAQEAFRRMTDEARRQQAMQQNRDNRYDD